MTQGNRPAASLLRTHDLCPHCKVLVLAKRLEHHIRLKCPKASYEVISARPIKLKPASAASTVPSSPEPAPCITSSTERLSRHPTTKMALETCDLCGCPIPAGSFRRHVIRECLKAPSALIKARPAKPSHPAKRPQRGPTKAQHTLAEVRAERAWIEHQQKLKALGHLGPVAPSRHGGSESRERPWGGRISRERVIQWWRY